MPSAGSLPAALVGEESWGGVNKSLKGTLQHLMRKKATSLLLKSAVNCSLIKPSGHLFAAEQKVPVLFESAELTLTVD